MSVNDEFQPNFAGQLGSGPGKHISSRLERMDHNTINNLENAIWSLWTLLRGSGHYGPFKLETTSGYTIETFDGDGSTSSFTLSVAIPREAISGYSIFYDNPYASGISPVASTGYLTSFSSTTNLSNTVKFDNVPPAGNKNVIVIYHNITEWPSSINSSAFLSDYVIS